MAIEIRVLTSEDVDAFRALRQEALETSPDSFGESPEEHRRHSREDVWSRIGGSPDKFVIGAFEDGKLVGTAGFFRNAHDKSKHRGYIWGMYVAPAARSHGLGRMLLAAAIERASGLSGLRWIDLEVGSQNVQARKLYESAGFVKYGTEQEALYFGGRSVDNDHMTLRLTS
jgi:ribosomal protein S18 acetylase RimI-like enzyme